MTDPLEAQEVEKRHTLLWELAEFRADLGKLFDEQIGRVHVRAAESSAALTRGSLSEPASAAVSAEPEIPTQRPASRMRARDSAAPSAAVAGDKGNRPHDPRERLDALAKLLDRRLKQLSGSPCELTLKPSED